MKFLLLTLATVCACSLSCERHEFEGKNGTKQLQESHAAHEAGHGTHKTPDADHDKGGNPAP